MHRLLVCTLVSAALLSGLSTPAEPCCMVPAGYEGSISQSGQEAVLFHHDGREDLILKIAYRITGKEMPDRFAWVITVPNEPDAYAVADAALFQEVHDWAIPIVTPPPSMSSGSSRSATPKAAAVPEGLEFGQAVTVGPYDIQPVRALGREALEGLNTWLSENGFPTEDPGHMAYFVDHKFTFLCVKVNPPEGKSSVAAAAGLDPLHLSFRSPEPYYPLRFSSRQGVFNVSLYVLTKDHFDYRTSGDSLQRMNWKDEGFRENVAVNSADFPKTLADAFGKGGFKDAPGRWHLNVLRAYGVNRNDSIATWKRDIFFATIPPPAFQVPIPVVVAAGVAILAIVIVVLRRRGPRTAGG